MVSFGAGNKMVDYFRGGARPKHSGKISTTKSKRKKYEEEEEDDEEDFEDDEEEVRPSRSRNSRSKGRKQQKQSSGWNLIPWRSQNSKPSKKKGLSIRETLAQVARTGQNAYKEMYRRAKVLKSSAFESMLLKATWPNDAVVPGEALTDIIKYSIPAFKYAQADAEEDPYYMTLHKLWTKMTEQDWRTITKSLYILHCISRDSSVDACEQFNIALKNLMKTRNPKKPNQKYFDVKILTEVDANSQNYQSFLKNYGNYLLFRMKSFNAKFSELQELISSSSSQSSNRKNQKNNKNKINKNPSADPTLSINLQESTLADILKNKKFFITIKKAQQTLQLLLQIQPNKNQINAITSQVMKIVMNDLKDLWSLYGSIVDILLQKNIDLTPPQQNVKALADILDFYKNHQQEVKDFLSSQSKLFRALKVKFPSSLDEKDIATEALKARLDELMKLSGGAIKKSSKENDIDGEDGDEEDEEEDDEQDEESEDEDDSPIDEEEEGDESADDDDDDDNVDEDNENEEIDETTGDTEEEEEQDTKEDETHEDDEADDENADDDNTDSVSQEEENTDNEVSEKDQDNTDETGEMEEEDADDEDEGEDEDNDGELDTNEADEEDTEEDEEQEEDADENDDEEEDDEDEDEEDDE